VFDGSALNALPLAVPADSASTATLKQMRTRGPSCGRRPLIVRSIAAVIGLLIMIPATAAVVSAQGRSSFPAPLGAPRPEMQRSTTTTTTPPPPPTEPVTTAPPTTAAPTTTTTAVPSTTTGLGRGASESDEASDRLNLVVILLFVLAGIIAVATVLFWRFTRPTRADVPAEAAMHWEDGTGEHPIALPSADRELPSADRELPSVDQALPSADQSPASFTTTPRTSTDLGVPVATVAASPVFQHQPGSVVPERVPTEPVRREPARAEAARPEPARPEPARTEAAGPNTFGPRHRSIRAPQRSRRPLAVRPPPRRHRRPGGGPTLPTPRTRS